MFWNSREANVCVNGGTGIIRFYHVSCFIHAVCFIPVFVFVILLVASKPCFSSRDVCSSKSSVLASGTWRAMYSAAAASGGGWQSGGTSGGAWQSGGNLQSGGTWQSGGARQSDGDGWGDDAAEAYRQCGGEAKPIEARLCAMEEQVKQLTQTICQLTHAVGQLTQRFDGMPQLLSSTTLPLQTQQLTQRFVADGFSAEQHDTAIAERVSACLDTSMPRRGLSNEDAGDDAQRSCLDAGRHAIAPPCAPGVLAQLQSDEVAEYQWVSSLEARGLARVCGAMQERIEMGSWLFSKCGKVYPSATVVCRRCSAMHVVAGSHGMYDAKSEAGLAAFFNLTLDGEWADTQK